MTAMIKIHHSEIPVMSNQNFWLSVRAMAAYLDGNWTLGEETLDRLHADMKTLSPEERIEYRREITLIVSQLSRLEMRMVEDGKAGSPAPPGMKWG
jgi:hypothetical protein